ncbi:MAG: hypothetical protein K2P58_03245 [Hyphomonadaceae bacterium]|nr:hypothetical protein [Hyphomonadaceae bacterium]
MKALVSDPWVVNAASAVVVGLMVGLAALLGFRQRSRLDRAAVEALATGEGQTVQDALIASNGSAALALLSSGALLIARTLADGVSVRIVSAGGARLQVTPRKVTIAFADIGFPPLHLPLKAAPPAWLVALAQGG